MVKTTLIVIFALLISNLCLGRKVQSINSGNWKDPKTWKNGIKPSLSDSVVINPGDTVFINSSSAKSFHLKNTGIIFFKSSTNSLNCSEIYFENGEITGNSIGILQTETISFFGNSILGKCDLKVSKTTFIKDSLIITSSSGVKKLGSITNNGTIINIANENINLSGNFENNGKIKFNKGALIFSNPAVIFGSLSVKVLKLSDSLIIMDTITVTEEIAGKGKLINKGIVQLGITDSKFNIDSINLGFPGNELHFIRKGKQTVPKISNNKARKIVFQGEGTFTLSNYVTIDTLEIRNNSSLEISSKIDLSSIVGNDGSKLLTSNNFYLKDINDLIFQKNSTIQINNNQELENSIQTGNLIINEGFFLTLNSDNDTLRIGGDFGGLGILNGNPIIEYNGKSRQIIKKRKYKKLIYNNSSLDSSTFYGNSSIENLEIKKGKLKIGDLKINKCQIDSFGQLIIGGNAPVFMDTTRISGSLIINSNEANPKFNFLRITSHGTFNNNSSSDITISKGVFNDGNFLGCLGTACDYNFLNEKVFFSGTDTVFISRIKAKKVYNNGIVFVKKKIGIDSLFNLSKGTLLLAVDTQNISGIMDFTTKGNKLVFNKKGNQKIPISLTNTHHLTFQNRGNKSISSNLAITGNLEIGKQAFLQTDSFQIIGGSNGRISIDSLSSLSLGHNYSTKSIEFPLNFSRIFCHDSSLVIYESKGNQKIDSKPHYGNLTIDDGAIDSCEKDISGDSLIVKGNLMLSESSLTLVVKNKTVDLNGNWNGPGNIDFTTGLFKIGGDGNSNGKVNEGKSEFIYDGKNSQKIKIGNYYNLTIDKIGRAYTKANEGSLWVKNVAWVKNGNLDFNSERCDILNLKIDDSVTFSSKYQEKYFKNILVNSEGLFLLDYDEEIYLTGNINCKGRFICKKGRIIFSDSLKNQLINGAGEIELEQIGIQKKSSVLEINSILKLNDTLFIKNGKIHINNEMLLQSSAYIKGETSRYPITGIGKITLKKIIKTGIYENINGLGLNISTPSSMGNTMITREFKSYELINQNSIKRTYTIEPDFITNLDFVMSFNYWESELNGNVEDELLIFKSDNFSNNWKEQGGIINTQENLVKIKSINTISKWTAGRSTPIPLVVDLIYFNAQRKEDNSILISWEVLFELNTKAYQINYSFDGIKFDSLTTCNAGKIMNYEFNWFDTPNSAIYFELLEIEFDNKINSLDTTLVYSIPGKNPIAWVYENKIYTKHFPTGTLNVYDIKGKLILQNSFDISSLSSGYYYIELLNEISRWTYKFLK